MPIPTNQKLVPVAISTRDFLLSKNLILSDTIEKYGSVSWANGINKPATIGLETDYIKPSLDIVDGALSDRSFQLNKNRFTNDSSTKNDLISVSSPNSQYYDSTTNKPYALTENDISLKSSEIRDRTINSNSYRSFDDNVKYSVSDNKLAYSTTSNEDYLTKYGKNTKGKFENAGNIIGGLATGRSSGFSPDGVVPNYDIKSSLSGRILGAAGIIDDTPLGKAGVTGLAFAMMNNAIYNVQQETLGNINTSITNLMSNGLGSVIVPNNDITVPSSGLGKATDILQKITGFEVPRSFLPDSYSFFTFDDKSLIPRLDFKSLGQSYFDDFGNNQVLVDNTGKGAQIALFRNLNASLMNGANHGGGYAPAYKDKTGNSGVSGEGYMTYANESDKYDTLKTQGIYGVNSKFSWGDDLTGDINYGFKNKKSLLSKTAELFKRDDIKVDPKIKTLVNRYDGKPDDPNSEISTINDGRISKGNGVRNANKDEKKTFCRTWTSYDRYDKVSSLQKHRGLYGNGPAGIRLSDITSSVLDANGFVRIAPTSNDKDIKRFMFSIENLAWSDDLQNLKECEIGPGDGRNKGRIMWFPPYNLTFNDTSSVKLESNEFIGRGEPLYTYNNTERSGTLNFKILTDHSSSYNSFKTKAIDEINRYLFGCEDLPEIVTKNMSALDVDSLEVAKAKNMQEQVKVEKPSFQMMVLELYYPNDISSVDGVIDGITVGAILSGYENGSGVGIGEYMGEYKDKWVNKLNVGKNVGFSSNIDNFAKIVNENKTASVKIIGYASSHGTPPFNDTLATNRANNLKKYLIDTYNIDSTKITASGGGVVSKTKTKDQDDDEARFARKCDISIVENPELSEANEPTAIKKDPEDDDTRLTDAVIDGLFCESSYFDYLNENDPIAYTNITESIKTQIKYFQPAFHSITPEGFNARLNFLKQCTRQGPTTSAIGSSTVPSNMAFGRPPVCILRIGDFYHTKIIMDNVSFEFNDDGVHWDLNPDGIGVQPTIVDVSISFKFIGGSSLNGPISKLQNAVSFNFFANTEMYDERSDRMTKDGIYQQGKWLDRGVVEDNTTATAKKTPVVNSMVENEKELSKTSVNSDLDDDKILTSGNNWLTIRMDNSGIITGLLEIGSKDGDKLSKDHNLSLEIVGTGQKQIAVGVLKKPSGSGKVTAEIVSTEPFSTGLGSISLSNPVNDQTIFTFRCLDSDSNTPLAFADYGLLTFTCPDKGLSVNSLVEKQTFNEIMADPCCQCYSEDSSGTGVINGETCLGGGDDC